MLKEIVFHHLLFGFVRIRGCQCLFSDALLSVNHRRVAEHWIRVSDNSFLLCVTYCNFVLTALVFLAKGYAIALISICQFTALFSLRSRRKPGKLQWIDQLRAIIIGVFVGRKGWSDRAVVV